MCLYGSMNIKTCRLQLCPTDQDQLSGTSLRFLFSHFLCIVYSYTLSHACEDILIKIYCRRKVHQRVLYITKMSLWCLLLVAIVVFITTETVSGITIFTITNLNWSFSVKWFTKGFISQCFICSHYHLVVKESKTSRYITDDLMWSRDTLYFA